MIHEVLSEFSAGIAESRGETRVARVEQEARRLERGGTQEHDAARELQFLVGLPVDDADAGGTVALLIVQDAGDDAVGPQGHPARGRGGRECRVVGAEVRPGHTASVTRTAVMTRGAPVVIDGEHRRAPGRQDAFPAKGAGHAVAHRLLGTVEGNRREKFPVGE